MKIEHNRKNETMKDLINKLYNPYFICILGILCITVMNVVGQLMNDEQHQCQCIEEPSGN